MNTADEVYMNDRPFRSYRVLDKGKHKGMYWVIISLGSHPCCYVGLPPGHKYYGEGYDNLPIECHGGLTYAAKDLHGNPIDIDLWWIGWDYAHARDYMEHPIEKVPYPHKWTIEELRKEVKDVLKQLDNPKKVK